MSRLFSSKASLYGDKYTSNRVCPYTKMVLLVIPVETGIQSFQFVLDTRLRGYDEWTD
jgi:hypothetical protein